MNACKHRHHEHPVNRQMGQNPQPGFGPGIACVVDLDNLQNKGQGESQRCLDVFGLAKALQRRGVKAGTVVRNWDFSPVAEAVWRGVGLDVLAANENCDGCVIAEAEQFATHSKLQWLILVSGDGDYCSTIEEFQKRGIRVEVWALRSNASDQLVKTADRVRYIGEFIAASRKETQERARCQVPHKTVQPTRIKLMTPWLGNKARYLSVH